MEKKIIICLALTVILGIPLAYGSEVTRSFSSDIVSVGCNLTISLSVTVTENETIYIIDETIPSGWEIVDPGIGNTNESGHIKWIYYSVTTPAPNKTLTYILSSPNQSGTYEFYGEYIFENMEEEEVIGGESQVNVSACTDQDNDGYDNCNPGEIGDDGLVKDCDDNPEKCGANCNPGITFETCDGYDNNCNGEIDEGVKTEFYGDNDGDGYGDITNTTYACFQPPGYVSNSEDCNDNNSSIHPGAEEVCNGIDDNCDGNIDFLEIPGDLGCPPEIIITNTYYDGCTTNFSLLTDFSNISNFILEKTLYGKIIFNEPVTIPYSISIDPPNTFIGYNLVEINTTRLWMLNLSATIFLYNLSLKNPVILRDGNLCPKEICTLINFSNNTIIFNVTSFSSYSAQGRCDDGTWYGECVYERTGNPNDKPKYCENGTIVDKASLCGCPPGKIANGDVCIEVSKSPSPPSAGGGGGGGGGGGAIQKEKTYSTTLKILTNLSLYNITIELTTFKTTQNIDIEETFLSPPSSMKLYKAYKITKNFNESEIKSVVFEFRVEKRWIKENNISNIYLGKYNGKWKILETEIINSNETCNFYRSRTDSLSYFAILGTFEEKTCKEGNRRCHEGNIEECINHSWKIIEECAFGCDSERLMCKPSPSLQKICEEGERRCLEKEIQECRNNKWVRVKICEEGCDTQTLTCRNVSFPWLLFFLSIILIVIICVFILERMHKI